MLAVRDMAFHRPQDRPLAGPVVTNVRTMLQAVMRLPDLTVHRAAALVGEHLVNRTRSRRIRRKRSLYFRHDL